MIEILRDLIILKASTKDDTAFNRGQGAGIQNAIWLTMGRMSADEIQRAEDLARAEVTRG